jgi:integration host factor subunit alpha
MSLTKNDLIERINDYGFTREKSAKIIETLIELMKSSLASGEDVLISGFGKFCVNRKNSRIGRNPATGEALELSERRVVTFKCSEKLKNNIAARQPKTDEKTAIKPKNPSFFKAGKELKDSINSKKE